MPELSTAAAKHLKRIRRRPNMPEWWPVLQFVLGAVVVLAIGFGFIVAATGEDAPRGIDQLLTTGDGVLPGPGPGPAPVSTVATTTETPTETTTGTSTETTTETTTGASVTTDPTAATTVPGSTVADTTTTTSAASGAEQVSLPFIGGDRIDVPAAALERARGVAQAAYGDQAVLGAVEVAFSSPDRIAFTLTVDPDGGGSAPSTAITVLTVLDGGVWTGSV